MPALAIYKGHTYRLLWLGRVRDGEYKGTKRARIEPLKGGGSVWVSGEDIKLVDNKPSTKALRA